MTAAEISRLAGVTRATVSNWRRRHADFPAPTGGTETSPAYDLDAVRSWLAARGQLPASSPVGELRIVLRADAGGGEPLALRLLPLVPPIVRLGDQAVKALAEMPDADLPGALAASIGKQVPGVLGVGEQAVKSFSPVVLHALLRCMAEGGAAATLDVLAEHLADDTAAGAYSTPLPLADLMAALLLQTPSRVLDPACGSGGLLSAAARTGAKRLFGQDVLGTQAALASIRAVLPDVKATIKVGDSLRGDTFLGLKTDAVLCNPPYGQRDWGHDDLAYDPRWEYGLPPKTESELAWVQHCLAHLDSDGRAVVLMPPGAAERAGGRRIRSELVRRGALRGVIALPPGVAPPLHIGLHLWLLAAPDGSRSEPQPVLFLDAAEFVGASDSGTTSSRRSRAAGSRDLDWSAMSGQIVGLWRAFDDDPERFESVPGVARSQSIVDLLDQTVDITPARHVRGASAPVDPSQQEALGRELRAQLQQAGSALVSLSGGQEWPPAGVEPLTWRTATVADLLRGGAVVLHRAAVSRVTGVDEAQEQDAAPLLTLSDVWGDVPASGSLREKPLVEHVRIECGDVIMPETLNGMKAVPARVADHEDAGCLLGPHLLLLRPDPERLDSWFLAGFLAAEDNIHSATTGASIIRLDVKRLRVPLMPLEQQQDYGRAFQHLHAIRKSARLATRLADETARQLAVGLTGGALLPPAGPPG
ncbi:N-6 DNA methylase [Saccharopolyspora shandongensis]|uniref:N-6 DNA methylase n=1 Tax=Saccharopolyspora shandongensis TaxID=418495 RepID=UPI0033E7E229